MVTTRSGAAAGASGGGGDGIRSAVSGAASFDEEKSSAVRPPRFNFDFSKLPRFLREGPWSPVAYVVIAAYALALAWSLPRVFPGGFVADDGIAERAAAGGGPVPATVRGAVEGAGALWCVGVIVWMVKVVGWWPFCTYTMISWTLLTLRYISSAVGLTSFASIIRFPAMCMCAVTVTVRAPPPAAGRRSRAGPTDGAMRRRSGGSSCSRPSTACSTPRADGAS